MHPVKIILQKGSIKKREKCEEFLLFTFMGGLLKYSSIPLPLLMSRWIMHLQAQMKNDHDEGYGRKGLFIQVLPGSKVHFYHDMKLHQDSLCVCITFEEKRCK